MIWCTVSTFCHYRDYWLQLYQSSNVLNSSWTALSCQHLYSGNSHIGRIKCDIMKINTSLQKNKRLTVGTYESQSYVSGRWTHKAIDIYHSRKLVPPLYEALLGLCVFLTCKRDPVSKYFTKSKLGDFLEKERVYIPLEVSSSLAKSEDGEKRAMSIVVFLLLRKQTLEEFRIALQFQERME